jgi:hypothetical protein
MSNSRSARRRLNQSTAVLLARFHAEVVVHGPGGYHGTVQHDRDCPGLKYQSMLKCRCKPEIRFRKLETENG